MPGELPPPAPRALFGRERLIEKIVCLAENLEPIALIGPGGIGKTSIALTLLHHDRIKARFGDNRRFIRCDQFPTSSAHFFACLSKVIGARVENPVDLEPLKALLYSKETLIVLDNAESILDPEGPDSRGIYDAVNVLCQFNTVCVCITSRITTVPPGCKRPRIRTLSKEAAREIFYEIYGDDERSGTIDNLLRQLEYHPLSITLLAAAAFNNLWDHERLAEEWYERRAEVLRTDHNESLAATIELSLTSPTFRKLGPLTRDILGVVAFFPQGVDEKNLDWLFFSIPNKRKLFDKFCLLCLTSRSNGYITMLAPIRDYLRPQGPGLSSPFLRAAKECYITRLSVPISPNKAEFAEAVWIKSEHMNVEYLLDVFTSVKPNSLNIWDACINFMRHLYWHKPRQTILKSKIENLHDDHPSKRECLLELSNLLEKLGNYAEEKRFLTLALTLERELGNESRVARVLRSLSGVNLLLKLREEALEQGEEALEMCERLGDTEGRTKCLYNLAWVLYNDDQLEAAKDTALRLIDLLPEKGEEYLLCKSHRVLAMTYDSLKEKDKAMDHFEVALRIATPFGWQELFSIHYNMAGMFLIEDKFDDANAHIERARPHTLDHAYLQGLAMDMQARIWYGQGRLDDARCEALRAVETFEELGGAQAVENGRGLRSIGEAMEGGSASSESDASGRKFLSHGATSHLC